MSEKLKKKGVTEQDILNSVYSMSRKTGLGEDGLGLTYGVLIFTKPENIDLATLEGRIITFVQKVRNEQGAKESKVRKIKFKRQEVFNKLFSSAVLLFSVVAIIFALTGDIEKATLPGLLLFSTVFLLLVSNAGSKLLEPRLKFVSQELVEEWEELCGEINALYLVDNEQFVGSADDSFFEEQGQFLQS